MSDSAAELMRELERERQKKAARENGAVPDYPPAAYFAEGQNGRRRFIPTRLALTLADETPFAVGGEALFVYRSGAYRLGGEEAEMATAARAVAAGLARLPERYRRDFDGRGWDALCDRVDSLARRGNTTEALAAIDNWRDRVLEAIPHPEQFPTSSRSSGARRPSPGAATSGQQPAPALRQGFTARRRLSNLNGGTVT